MEIVELKSDSEMFAPEFLAEWRELLRADPQANAFSYPAFVRLSGEYRILTVRRDGKLVGLAHLAVEVRRGVRHGHFGRWDYSDFLCIPELHHEVGDSIFRHVAQDRSIDLLDVTGVDVDSNMAHIVAPIGRRHGLSGLRGESFEHQQYPQISLTSGYEGVLKNLSKQFAGRVKNPCRILAKKLEDYRLEYADPSSVRTLGPAHIGLNRVRQEEKGNSGIGDAERFVDWLEELVQDGKAHLAVMYSGTRPIASILCLIEGKSFRYLQSGFDPEFSKLSPGNAMIGDAIQCACAKGIETFDFMRGLEPAKMRWMPTLVSTYRVVLSRPSLKSLISIPVLRLDSRRRLRRSLAKLDAVSRIEG